MNDIINTSIQTPIEIALGIDENNMTTARKLYDFLELSPSNYSKWCKTNIVDNEFAEENVDYWAFVLNDERNFNPKPTTDYKLTAHFAKKLSQKGNGAKAELAREYFTRVEEKTKETAINRSQLSPQMQMLMGMVETQARQELEQKRQAEQLNRIEEKQTLLTETFRKSADREDFKTWCKKCIGRIAESPNFAFGISKAQKYALAWNESYERLNEERPCRLKQRVKTAQGEALQNGATHSKVKEINQLTIIAADKDLKPVYEMVIKEMVSYYCMS